jgi:hypothetical protein
VTAVLSDAERRGKLDITSRAELPSSLELGTPAHA